MPNNYLLIIITQLIRIFVHLRSDFECYKRSGALIRPQIGFQLLNYFHIVSK